MCIVLSQALPSHFVVSVRSAIVGNVLTPTLVGIMLFIKDILICQEGLRSSAVYLGDFPR